MDSGNETLGTYQLIEGASLTEKVACEIQGLGICDQELAAPMCESGTRPDRLMLCDNGTTRHMFGRQHQGMVFNVRHITPVSFNTAGNSITLDTEGDAVLRDGTVLTNILINLNTDLSLLAEGTMTDLGDDEAWAFNHN